MLALNRRLRAPPVVAAILRLFPLLVAQARRQAPDTHRDDGVKYDMTALPDAFVLAQHPHCFLLARRCTSGEGENEGEDVEAQHSARMMVDAAAALAVTFEVLLNEFRLRPRRRYDDAPIEGRELLLQIRAYQDAVAAAVVAKRRAAVAPTRASSSV